MDYSASDKTIDAVNVAIIEALGFKTTDNISELTLRLNARELPTVTVTKYVRGESGFALTQELKKLRLREVASDGM